NLKDNALVLDEIARDMPLAERRAVLTASVDLLLKMLETITLSSGAIPQTLKSLANTASDILK
ncbi:MAG: hypothetical protein LBF22_01950, partial [Deltaproteobacteria bacterium]|nr:hypothetical protein [Deltaproteobacteria bacterium]